jgi:hypothetical protein
MSHTYSGVVANYADSQVTKTFHRTSDGDWVYEVSQDCDAILDANKYEQNTDNPLKHGDLRMVARIPFIVMAKWRNELGIDYWNPDHQDAVDRLLESSDWRWLRVDGAQNNNVSFSGINIGPESKIFEAPKPDKRKVLAADGTPMVAS